MTVSWCELEFRYSLRGEGLVGCGLPRGGSVCSPTGHDDQVPRLNVETPTCAGNYVYLPFRNQVNISRRGRNRNHILIVSPKRLRTMMSSELEDTDLPLFQYIPHLFRSQPTPGNTTPTVSWPYDYVDWTDAEEQEISELTQSSI